MQKYIRRAGWMAAPAVILAVIVGSVMNVTPVAAQAQPRIVMRAAGTASIGVTIRDVTSDDASKARISPPAGVYVDSVVEGSPAAKAGFQAGDIVVDFDGERVRSASHFTRLVQESVAGRQLTAVVVRGTSKQTLSVVPEAASVSSLIRRNMPQLNAQRIPRELNLDLNRDRLRLAVPATGATLGVSVTPLSDQLASYFGVKDGALVTAVTSGSPAADAGVRAGDVVTMINGQPVTSAADITRALRDRQNETVEIAVTRDRKSLMLKASVPTSTNPAGRSGRGRLPV
jgi:serine protease Do